MIRATILCIFSSIILSGCAKLDQDYPKRNFYSIDVNRKDEKSVKTFNKTLEINRFNIFSKFSGKEFTYRISESRYSTDFYNQFFSTPVTLISVETYEWLNTSGVFKDIINRAIPVEPDYLLSANIIEIYADLRKSQKSKSILSIQFFITDERSEDNDLIFKMSYYEEVAVKSKSPEALVKGWNKALENILINLEKDLSKLNLE